MDIVDQHTRSRYMSGIKSKDTNPELKVRKELHRRGFRYRIHNSSLPGKPDIVMSKHKTVILVHGCFWHMHDCKLFKLPQTRRDFWKNKLENNVKRDKQNNTLLNMKGWRVFVIWECSIKRKDRQFIKRAIDAFEEWLETTSLNGQYGAENVIM